MNEDQFCPVCDSGDTECTNMQYLTYVCHECGERWAADEEEGNLDRSSSYKTRLDRERD